MLRTPAKARAGDRVAVLSPSFAGPAAGRVIDRYNPDAVVCVGVPFGHTRPQWILPYGGELTVDGAAHAISADYR